MATKKTSLPGLMGGVPAKKTTIDPKFGQGPGTVKPPKSSGAGQLPIKPGKPKVEKPILLEEPDFPEAGTIIGYQPGVNGMRIPIENIPLDLSYKI